MRTLAGFIIALVAPWSAAAQQPPASQPSGSSTPLQITEIENGFVVAPDVRFTQVNDRFATLAGAYGGWQTDKTLLVGGAAYWLANRDDDFKMQYFGGLVRWNFLGDRPLRISTGVLVGGGTATLGRTYGELFDLPPGTALSSQPRGAHFRGGQPITSDTRVRVNDDFFVTEPQLTLLWSVKPWLRIDAGAGYRFIGASDLLGDELHGPSASLAVQIGR
jgi:hypothetical protein